MKIQIPRRELKDAVAGFNRIVSRRTTLPILGGLRFNVSGTAVAAEATDLEQKAVFHFQNAISTGSGTFVASFEQIKDLAKGADGDNIEFTLAGKDTLTVVNSVAGQVVTRDLITQDPAEWPELAVDVKVKPVDGFLESFQRVAPFSSTDETRYTLKGCYLDVSEKGEKKARIVATDGRRLTMCNTMTLPITESCIIPATKFLVWSQLEGEAKVGTAKKGDTIWFALKTGPWTYTVKAINGTYPNYRQVIPAEVGSNTIVFADQDCAALKRILQAFPGDDSGLLALRKSANGAVAIGGKGKDDAKETTVVLSQGSTYTGTTAAVGVNRYYLMECIEAGFRRFAFADDTSPLVSDDGHGGKHVIMPMRVADVPVEPPAEAAEGQVSGTTNAVEPEPTKKEAAMPNEEKAGRVEADATAMDKLMTACEAARLKVKEANQALSEIVDAVKVAVKEQRQQKAQVEDFKAALSKLQSIKV